MAWGHLDLAGRVRPGTGKGRRGPFPSRPGPSSPTQVTARFPGNPLTVRTFFPEFRPRLVSVPERGTRSPAEQPPPLSSVARGPGAPTFRARIIFEMQ